MNLSSVIELKPNPNIPEIHPGDTVKVSIRLKEESGERVQVFQGIVIRMRKRGAAASFTVRRIVYGIGVERTFLLYSPLLEKVEVVQEARVRRAKLYYLRGLSSKQVRAKLKPKARWQTKASAGRGNDVC